MGFPVTGLGHLSAATFLLLCGGCAGSSSHSLHIFYTLVMDASQEGAQYIVVSYVDDQLAARFDPPTRRMVPQASWLLNVREEDLHLWERISRTVSSSEEKFRSELTVLHIYHNVSRGFHSWQNMIGCELSDHGQKQGVYQYGYDGKTFISLDQKTLTWIAADVHAQVTKRRWEAEPLIAENRNHCLKNVCIKLLQKSMMYGKDSLLRKERPVAKVARRNPSKGLETLICRVYGFYPKELNVTWRKDGELWENTTSRAGVLPNSDGTYHTWMSIDINQKERDHFRCYVEHAGVTEPLIVAWQETAFWSSVGFVAGVVVVGAAVVTAAAVAVYVIKCVEDVDKDMPTSSQEFEMAPVMQDQDQRLWRRMPMEARPQRPSWACW